MAQFRAAQLGEQIMTTIECMDGKDITASPDRLAKAEATIKAVVADHNSKCAVNIKTRMKGGTVEVTACTKGGRATKWLACTMLTQVQSFADGVADAVASATPRPDTPFGAWLAGPPKPEREFVSHADEAAYFFGSLNGNL